jgi:hypothetical protein
MRDENYKDLKAVGYIDINGELVEFNELQVNKEIDVGESSKKSNRNASINNGDGFSIDCEINTTSEMDKVFAEMADAMNEKLISDILHSVGDYDMNTATTSAEPSETLDYDTLITELEEQRGEIERIREDAKEDIANDRYLFYVDDIQTKRLLIRELGVHHYMVILSKGIIGTYIVDMKKF